MSIPRRTAHTTPHSQGSDVSTPSSGQVNAKKRREILIFFLANAYIFFTLLLWLVTNQREPSYNGLKLGMIFGVIILPSYVAYTYAIRLPWKLRAVAFTQHKLLNSCIAQGVEQLVFINILLASVIVCFS